MSDNILLSPQPAPSYRIGTLPIYGELALAPMLGFSDPPFRLLCREFGSALSYTPLLLDLVIIQKGRRRKPMIDYVEAERPLIVQIESNDPDRLALAAQALEVIHPDAIDLNVGCPARKVVAKGRGAALMCQPDRLAELTRRLVQATSRPVTAKIRLGWDVNSRNYLEIAHILEDNGVAALAVHGRTRAQAYSGEADWGAIAEVKQHARVPVLANGDVTTVEDIDAIKRVTGCDGVLIGRGAIGNPWIFSRRNVSDVSYDERVAMMQRHLLAMVDHYGEQAGVVQFRKHAVKYTRALPGSAAMRVRLLQQKTTDQVFALLAHWGEEE